MTALVAILLAGAGCLVFRIAPVVLSGRRSWSPALLRKAGLVAPAAFAAIAATAIFAPPDEGGVAPDVLAGAAVALLVGRRWSGTTGLAAGIGTAAVVGALV